MLNRNQIREDPARPGHKIPLTVTENNVAIRLNLPARPGSDLPGRVRDDDRSETPKDRLAPELAGRATLPRRHNTRDVGEPVTSSVPPKEQTAACGWYLSEASAKSARA